MSRSSLIEFRRASQSMVCTRCLAAVPVRYSTLTNPEKFVTMMEAMEAKHADCFTPGERTKEELHDHWKRAFAAQPTL